MNINHPIEGHTGITEVGPYTIEFKDGRSVKIRRGGEDSDLNDGAIAYLKRRGYGFGGTKGARPEAQHPSSPDPREVGDEQVGARLRDGAVDPREGDFLAPTNAGQANPHGPDVVSPEVHASQGVRPVKPGDVHVDDPDTQDDAETKHVEQSTDGTPVGSGSGAPAGNASLADWQEYARTQGATDADLDGKSRNDLRDTYGA
jgi:hypothetical protein